MSPQLIIGLIAAYFVLLLIIARITGKEANEQSFFVGNRNSPWFIVAFGMIGASLSGVTFISVPGWVGASGMSYFQVVLGYLLGYFFIAFVLLPLYYKLQLTSIYSFLRENLGLAGNKVGAAFFLVSRVLGAAFRLYLVCLVLYNFVLGQFGIPFPIVAIISIVLIWLYTNKGGIKTIIWTDTFQTVFMLAAICIAFYQIALSLDLNLVEAIGSISESDYSRVFQFEDGNARNYFWKQFLGGALITITMTGMDQDMMQKNLSCKNIGDAQKNMVTFSIILVFVNLIFLGFGVLMFQYIDAGALDTTSMGKSDEFFPALALSGNLGMATAVFFVLGLIAAAYSSADSALTALTTSVYVDFIQNPGLSEQKAKRLRRTIHVAVSAVLLIVIVLFERVADSSVIDQLLTVAGYTYGPILGMFIYCLLPTRKIVGFGGYIWLIALVSPVLSYLLEKVIPLWLPKYQMGYELLLVNGLICLGLLLILSRFTNSPRLQSQSK